MRKAAVEAGIVKSWNSDKLWLCLEPEGASIQCREDIEEDEFKIDGLDEIGGIDDQFDQLDELYPKVTLIDDDGNDIFSDKQENNQNTDKKNTEQKKPKRNIGIKRPSIPTKEKPKTDNNKTSNNRLILILPIFFKSKFTIPFFTIFTSTFGSSANLCNIWNALVNNLSCFLTKNKNFSKAT